MSSNTFDKDLLTFFDAPDGSRGRAGLDFGELFAISRVTNVMRGDGNDREIDNKYELVCWIEKKWVLLGKKIVNEIFLEFDNYPSDVLFLLHTRTKGKEEKIFTYENGKQK